MRGQDSSQVKGMGPSSNAAWRARCWEGAPLPAQQAREASESWSAAVLGSGGAVVPSQPAPGPVHAQAKSLVLEPQELSGPGLSLLLFLPSR